MFHLIFTILLGCSRVDGIVFGGIARFGLVLVTGGECVREIGSVSMVGVDRCIVKGLLGFH